MFAICVEASHARGMGHLYRALALAEALGTKGVAAIVYINDDASAVRVLQDRKQPFRTVALEGPAGWESDLVKRDGIRVWINDRRDTAEEHARQVLATGARLASFDDRGAGGAFTDLNIVAIGPQNGERLPGKRVLTGLSYLVLDAAIAHHRRRRVHAKSLVVSMGGSDTYGLTVEVVLALRNRHRPAVIVLGPGFAHAAALERVIDSSFEVKRAVPSLAVEFSRHDLAITAGGMTAFETNAAGLPCILIAAEPWEQHIGLLLSHSGGAVYAGYRDRIDFSTLDAPLDIPSMSLAALNAVPVDGAARVATELLAL